jgi:two-component system OmpR family sensor kinase
VSLRSRLLIGILALLVVAIGVTDAVTYTSLRSFLLGQIDEQTDVAQHQLLVAVWGAYARSLDAGSTLAARNPTQWLVAMAGGSGDGQVPTCLSPTGTAAGGGGSRSAAVARTSFFAHVSPDVSVEVLAPDHRLLFDRPSGACDPLPALPRFMPVQVVPLHRTFGAEEGAYFPNQLAFTMASSDGTGIRYRAEAVQLPGGILVTAVALGPDDQTLASLVHVEIIVSASVLLAAVIVALLVTRVGLRPLRDMTDAAGAIAGGDLSRRIRRTEARSEVGRLGAAFNAMIGQIEAAFSEQARSERRLRRFVADASHELRTPLTSIRGYAELLRKGAFADEAARDRAAVRIEHEAARMGILVEDLLLLARLDQGRPLDCVPVDLGQVVTDAVADATVARNDHQVAVEIAGPVPVAGDPVRLRQVVDNLVGNALVHTPPGTFVRVSAAVEGAAGVVRVADQGPGLAPEQASQVFERFYRARASRTGAGAGLGLAIVASLAHAHGGGARVRSEPGQGAVFEVWIPLAGLGPGAVGAKAIGTSGPSADVPGTGAPGAGAGAPGAGAGAGASGAGASGAGAGAGASAEMPATFPPDMAEPTGASVSKPRPAPPGL